MKNKYKYALFDTWDFSAQYIFFTLGIPNVVAFNKISLLTYQMEYAGTINREFTKNVPGEFPQNLGKSNIKIIISL